MERTFKEGRGRWAIFKRSMTHALLRALKREAEKGGVRGSGQGQEDQKWLRGCRNVLPTSEKMSKRMEIDRKTFKRRCPAKRADDAVI
jgi:hypothetical protein